MNEDIKILPDLIVAWPVAYDYPRFRAFIERNRKMFNKVIITWTLNDIQRDFREAIQVMYPDWTFVCKQKEDWFNDAVHAALRVSTAPYIMFMEQDFICTDQFLKDILDAKIYSTNKQVYYLDGERRHFCCFIVSRSALDQTNKMFSARDGLDSFGVFTREMEVFPGTSTAEITKEPAKHLSGLTHNYRLFQDGKYELMTGKEALKAYNKECLESSVTQLPEWVTIMTALENTQI